MQSRSIPKQFLTAVRIDHERIHREKLVQEMIWVQNLSMPCGGLWAMVEKSNITPEIIVLPNHRLCDILGSPAGQDKVFEAILIAMD